MRWKEAYSICIEDTYSIFVGRSKKKRTLEISRYRWKEILKRIVNICENMNWNYLTTDRDQWRALVN
jgi:hypothetical protein